MAINDVMLAGSMKQLKGGETGMMSPNTWAGVIDSAETATLVGGDAVYISGVTAGVISFRKISSSSQVPFGFVFVSHKDASFKANAPVEIASDLSVIWLEASTTISAGADIIPVSSGSMVVTADGSLPICGKAIDAATAANTLIRVLVRTGWGLTAPTFSSASVTGNLTVAGVTTLAKVVGPGTSYGIYNKRIRVAIASVNAGADLVAAVAGLKYRFIGARVIAIGGAVTSSAATGLAIYGTQTTPVALLSIVKANLTQSAVCTTTGNTVLADGASFVTNDAATALTIKSTTAGAYDLAGATYIDVIIDFAVEA